MCVYTCVCICEVGGGLEQFLVILYTPMLFVQLSKYDAYLRFFFYFNSYNNSLSYFSFIFSLQDEAAYDVLQRGPAKQLQVITKEVCIY